MQAWLDGLAPGFGPALMWTIVALIGLLVLLILIRIFRGLTFGTFVAGGRNRKTRLAVMDATAVDSHRRLVLVRRDDVEHLILIGGPTDVVVEQNIRLVPAPRRPAVEEPVAAPRPVQQQAPAAAAPRPPVRPVESRSFGAAPKPVAAPPPAPPVSTPPVIQRPVEPSPAPSAQPSPEQRPVAAPHTASAQAVPAARAATPPQRSDSDDDVQDAMLEELDVMLETAADAAEPADAPAVETGARGSLDEEMSRLLNDLSGPRR